MPAGNSLEPLAFMDTDPPLPLHQLPPGPTWVFCWAAGVPAGSRGCHVYEELTAVSRHENCRFWLQDLRRRTLNDPHITTWLLTDYFPARARQLGGRLCGTYLVGPLLHQHILSDPAFVPVSAYADKNFVVAFLGDEGEAIQWLQEQARG
jgi:hypothetical protein